MSFLFKIRDFFNPPINKIESAGIKQGNVVLDYGCGPGSYSIAAAETVGSSGKVYAVDIHPLALKKLRERAKKRRLSNVETIQTDSDINLENNSVDIIICFDVIHELDELPTNLIEFHRVLKSNAKLIADDHHYEGKEIISSITQNGLFKYIDNENKIYSFLRV